MDKHPPPASGALYVVGLGSNLGDRRAILAGACDDLRRLPQTRLLASSRLSETAPVGPPQGPYLNGAVLLDSALSPRSLLDHLLRVEQRWGRERRERWGPRTLDLDLLFSPGLCLDEPGLTLPHPRLHERLFALEPLVEVAPWACDPATNQPYRRLLLALRSAG